VWNIADFSTLAFSKNSCIPPFILYDKEDDIAHSNADIISDLAYCVISSHKNELGEIMVLAFTTKRFLYINNFICIKEQKIMGKFNPKKIIIVLIHAFIVWALCGATIGIGRSVMSMELTLIIHAIGAPIFATLVSLVYYKKFNYTNPLQTALIFTLFIVVVDAGLVAPVFEKSYDMFKSVLGTWIPFSLIFLSTFITGLMINRKEA
jgi:hypothetical protein